MPSGTFAVDSRNTFSAAILMSGGPRLRFGTAEQDVSTSGERKWSASVAVTFLAQPPMKPVSDVIDITVTGPASDPFAAIPPGTSVEFDSLRMGISAPQPRENGKGISGGRPYFMATGVRASSAQNGRPLAAASSGKGE